MTLILLIFLPVAGGAIAWLVEHASGNRMWPRWICQAALAGQLALAVALWARYQSSDAAGPWMLGATAPWIPQWGVSFTVAMDGLSVLLVMLTAALGLISVAASWTEIQERVGFFHFCLMWVLTGITGVFLALDLFLFYFFWELMLVPMYLLIAIWGHERRIYASIKFFLFTQLSGLMMLLAILYLVILHARQTGVTTFAWQELLQTNVPPVAGMLMMLGFFVAFAVKLPAFPFHTWLPDAHTEAPTAGSVILAGLLLKTGAYGLIRFVVPLFPMESLGVFRNVAMALAVVGIIYGAALAFAQTDFKRLVAYTSVSHMGFVLLGVFAWNHLALQGAVMQIICHGFATGALFVLAGALQERLHTRDMRLMGGFWTQAPRMGAVALFFAMASLGLPGLGSFLGEFFVLTGGFAASKLWASLAAIGLVAATIYSLWMVQAVFFGADRSGRRVADLTPREMAMMMAMMAALVWLGLYPQPVIDTARPALRQMQTAAQEGTLSQTPALARLGGARDGEVRR